MISGSPAAARPHVVGATVALAPAEAGTGGTTPTARRITVPFVTDRTRLPAGNDMMFGSDFPGPDSLALVTGDHPGYAIRRGLGSHPIDVAD